MSVSVTTDSCNETAAAVSCFSVCHYRLFNTYVTNKTAVNGSCCIVSVSTDSDTSNCNETAVSISSCIALCNFRLTLFCRHYWFNCKVQPSMTMWLTGCKKRTIIDSTASTERHQYNRRRLVPWERLWAHLHWAVTRPSPALCQTSDAWDLPPTSWRSVDWRQLWVCPHPPHWQSKREVTVSIQIDSFSRVTAVSYTHLTLPTKLSV